MPTAAIVIHDGYTDAEFLVTYHTLKAHGFNVTVYSKNGGSVTGVMGWVHKESRPTIAIGEFLPDILALIGGVKSVEKLRLDRGLIMEIRRQNDANRIIASVCHGAQLLIEADIIRGRKILGYNSIRKDLENAGAVWPDGQEVWVDGNIVSARHYDFAGEWMAEVLKQWEKHSLKT